MRSQLIYFLEISFVGQVSKPYLQHFVTSLKALNFDVNKFQRFLVSLVFNKNSVKSTIALKSFRFSKFFVLYNVSEDAETQCGKMRNFLHQKFVFSNLIRKNVTCTKILPKW